MNRLMLSAKIVSSIVAVGVPLLFANPVTILAQFVISLGPKVSRYDPSHLPSLTSWIIHNHPVIRGLMLALGCFSFVGVLLVWRSKQAEPAKLSGLLWIVSASTGIAVLTFFVVLLALLFLPNLVTLQSIE